MTYVMDAGALIAYLQGEDGAEDVRLILADRSSVALVHAVNAAEVHYYLARISDEQTADQAIADLRADGVVVRFDMDDAFWRDIARLKARGRISVADCCCIALASREGAVAVTTDHHEFDPLVDLNFCSIRFVR
jgi:PIN domain nuclease of toxin-antitoxin system